VIDVHLMCIKAHTNPLSGLDPLLSIDELAEDLGVSIKTIYEWRQTGRGPIGIRMGRHLKFAVSDVCTWLDEKRESQPGRSAETG